MMKLDRKIKDNETVCGAEDKDSYAKRSRWQSGQRSKLCFNNKSKANEANLMKLHRKLEHTKKVCRAQQLGSYAQGQGHNQVRGEIAPKIKSE